MQLAIELAVVVQIVLFLLEHGANCRNVLPDDIQNYLRSALDVKALTDGLLGPDRFPIRLQCQPSALLGGELNVCR